MATVELEDLQAFAHNMLVRISAPAPQHAFILALQGELGSGKTTFMQALARELGITESVKSPTYVLMKNYSISHNGFTKLVHIDAYRLEKPEEFQTLDPETFLKDPKALVCIEWPERAGGLLPTPDLLLHFSHGNDETGAREIQAE